MAGAELMPPPPPHRRISLVTVDDVRVEMARVYRDMRCGRLASQEGTRLAYVLDRIARAIEGADIERRVVQLEQTAAKRVAP